MGLGKEKKVFPAGERKSQYRNVVSSLITVPSINIASMKIFGNSCYWASFSMLDTLI